MNILPILDNSYYNEAAPFKFVSFVIVLGLLLISMGTYRSPAVALMPDVTPKPLRSKGNAIINLMGAVGGIIYLGVAAVMYPDSKTAGLDHINYQPLFIVAISSTDIAPYPLSCISISIPLHSSPSSFPVRKSNANPR